MGILHNETLLETLKSKQTSSFTCIELLRQNTDLIGLHHAIVKCLHSFPYDELEFLIPQLVQLLVAYETDSMALEDFLIEYCTRYPHFSLIVFWNLQAYVFELRNDPNSYLFQVVRRFINQLQNIVFGTNEKTNRHVFRENLQPSLVLCGAIAASLLVPWLSSHIAPVIVSQGKQPKSFVFKLANFRKNLTENLTSKNKVDFHDLRTSGDRNLASIKREKSTPTSIVGGDVEYKRNSLATSPCESDFCITDEEDATSVSQENSRGKSIRKLYLKNSTDHSENQQTSNDTTKKQFQESTETNNSRVPKFKEREFTNLFSLGMKNSQSLPDLPTASPNYERPHLLPAGSESALALPTSDLGSDDRDPQESSHLKVCSSDSEEQIALRVHYAKRETNFIMSLQNISLRLSLVPKEARLSALRAELSILNATIFPSEIDIPQLLPFTSNKNKKYHKILKLNVNEACVLNSAERVPYLLLIEYLSDEFDFDTTSEANRKILAGLSVRGVDAVSRRVSSLRRSSASSGSPNIPSVKQTLDIDKSLVDAAAENDHEADLSDLPHFLRKRLQSENNVNELLEQTGDREIDVLRPGQVLQTAPKHSAEVLADQMRIASVMLQQLEVAEKTGTEHSEAIKTRLINSMISLQDRFESIDYMKMNEMQNEVPNAGERKLENDFKLGEDWETKKRRIRKSSAYGHLKNWELCSVIAKNGDDLPQEAFACQLITMMSGIWKRRGVDVWTRRMKILITSAQTGLVETITNAISIHSIKKSLTEILNEPSDSNKGRIYSLLDYFRRLYGPPTTFAYKSAQLNFAKSLAAYSIICYVLQIKDRHNGNIMLDSEGHIIHIDFGFLLSNSPGSMGFEAAPFKLTSEYVNLLGGTESSLYSKFVSLCKDCFRSLRSNSKELIDIVELMQKDSTLPCFKNGPHTSVLFKNRLQLHLSEEDADNYVESVLVGKSLGSMYTRLYDQFQMITQGIYS